MLSKKQIEDVCLIAGPVPCRYLQADEFNWGQWHCVKLKPSAKAKADKVAREYIDECTRKGIAPTGNSGVAWGDYCGGYPLYRHIEVGYDK